MLWQVSISLKTARKSNPASPFNFYKITKNRQNRSEEVLLIFTMGQKFNISNLGQNVNFKSKTVSYYNALKTRCNVDFIGA